jgi:gamma-tubulin complex component 2
VPGGGQSTTAELYANLSTQGLKGIEAFTLDYQVSWPLSIVLSRRILTKYQLLSRLLYFSKHVERRLLTSWMALQICKEIPAASMRELLMESYLLRHRMLHFIQNFVYYITFEVIHPRNHEFEAELSQAIAAASAPLSSPSSSPSKDINEIMELHERFLDNCLKECLLASSDLLKILTKIMTTCLLFADHMVKLFAEIEQKFKKQEEFRRAQRVADRRQATRSPAAVAMSKANEIKSTDSQKDKENKINKKQIEKLQENMATKHTKLMDYSELVFQEIKHESFHRILMKFSATFDTQVSLLHTPQHSLALPCPSR